jgi:hypothetical protein
MVNESTYRSSLEERTRVLQNCRKYTILQSPLGTLTPFQKEFVALHGSNYKVNYPGKNF